jgi:beta-glucosidase
VPFYEGRFTLMTERYNAVPYIMGQLKHLGMFCVVFSDSSRGVVLENSNLIPFPMARDATKDVDLKDRVGEATGKEA